MADNNKIEKFSASLDGKLVRPGDPEYDESRAVWNGMIDKRPALIVQCGVVSDVVESVNFARDNGLLVSVKGGGHGVAGKAVCDDGLMIDLSGMKNVNVDAESKTATVEAGATIGDVDRETQKFGLATPVGVVSKTGIAGLTMGGGIGYLGRKYGLTLDNLLSVELINYNGDIITANETENPDLFWALRGGGGNFGVVVSFEFRLHEVGPKLMSAQIFYPIEECGKILRSYRKFSSQAADEIACYALVVKVPPVPPFPERFQTKTAIAIVACHSGELEVAREELAPLETFGNPILSLIQPMDFVSMQQGFDAGVPSGMRYYWKAHYFDRLTDEMIEVFVSHVNPLPGSFSLVGFEPLGGAINRVEKSATAFSRRDANYVLGIWSGWEDPEMDQSVINWTRRLHQKMTPFAMGGVYSNYLDQDDEDQASAAFGTSYERLRAVKAKYDPENFFRINHNIKPKKAVRGA